MSQGLWDVTKEKTCQHVVQLFERGINDLKQVLEAHSETPICQGVMTGKIAVQWENISIAICLKQTMPSKYQN